MFGLNLFARNTTVRDKDKSIVSSPSPVMIGDFVGTYSEDNPAITPKRSLYSSPSGIITLELLQNYNTKNTEFDKLFNNGIIGKCDGEFPVTNPVKNNIYYYADDKKYYKCINGSTAVVSTPDNNFEEISLYQLSLNGGGASTVNISGDIIGSGVVDETGKIINIDASLNQMTKYSKQEYSAITSTDTPILAIGKLEGGLLTKADTNGSYPNMSVGTASKVLNSLSISLNGGQATKFDGSGAVSLDITASKIGAAASNHDHSGLYQPVGNYAEVGHKHSKADISDMPTQLPNPYKITIRFADTYVYTYDGTSPKDITVTPENIGAQPAGDYANKSHTHRIGQIGSLEGYIKPSKYDPVAPTDSIVTAIGKLEKALDGKQNSGNYALADHNHSSLYAPLSHTHTIAQIGALTGYVKATTAAAVSASDTILVAIGKLEKSLDGKQASGSYAPATHGHAWDSISGKPSAFTPTAHNQASNTITAMTGYAKPSSTSAISASDSLNAAIGKLEKALDSKQAAGSYAAANHNHDTVYAKVSHGTHVPAPQTANNKVFLRNDNTWQTITPANIGAAAASHTHTGYLATSGGTISGALTVTGQILSNADVVAYSDARFKTNLEIIGNPIEKLLSINGYKYDMLGVENSRQVGVIAQEVEKILPEAVFKDKNGHLAVRYTNLIPLLIEAFKQQQLEINLLKSRLEMEVR